MQKYDQDLTISSVHDTGVYACSTVCPRAALDAGAVYYKQFQIAGHGTITVYYDQAGKIVGTGRDLDGDGHGDSYDSDADGDGVSDTYDRFPLDASRWTDQVGEVAGQLSVSPGGAATYSIPIATSPGTAGVQPQLTLSYNSQSGNGLLGIGWSLGGLSVITRCPTTLATDGYIDGIDLDANDKFCLDGQRLVAVPGTGTYGADGTEYRTQIDGFSRIISYGTSGNGPSYFSVWTKAGDIIEYGVTEGAKARIPGRYEKILTWAQNRVSDVYGNYFKLHYIVDSNTGEQYPDRIEYTGNTSQGMSPDHTIQFVYANRSDVVKRYVAGAALSVTKLLTEIRTPAFNYTLSYEQVGLTQRNRLLSVLQCDKSNRCLPPVRFEWQGSGTGLQQNSTYNSSIPDDAYFADAVGYHYASRGVEILDVNGDGRQDILQSYLYADNVVNKRVYLNDGQRFNYHTGYSNSIPAPFYITKNDNEDGGGRIIDINGDGLADLVFSARTTTTGDCQEWDAENERWLPLGCRPTMTSESERIQVYKNVGNSWVYDSAYSGSGIEILLDGKDGGVRFGDVNGDGLLDLLRLWYPHIDFYGGNAQHNVYLNTGVRFVHDQAYSNSLAGTEVYFAGREDGGHHDLGTRLADINGDGMQDLIQAFNAEGTQKYNGSRIKHVYLSTGTRFVYDSTYTTSLPNVNFTAGVNVRKSSYSHNFSTSERGTELIDINNDGLLDIIQSWRINSMEKYHSAYLNTGTHFVPHAGYAPPEDMPLRININEGKGATQSGGTVFSDINNEV